MYNEHLYNLGIIWTTIWKHRITECVTEIMIQLVSALVATERSVWPQSTSSS